MRNPLSIRITDGLRGKLDAACKGSGRSLTQEVTKRLNDSFAIKAEPDPHLRALLYLVGHVTLYTGKEWKTNPWMFQVFRAAASSILERYAPPGELRPPETWLETVAKFDFPPGQLESMPPQAIGFFISNLIHNLLTGMKEPPPEVSVPSGSWAYTMPQAREALGVPFDPTGLITDLKLVVSIKEGTP